MASMAINLATIYPSAAQQVEVILTGTSTAWTAGTTFSVSGGTGASVVSKSVASATSAAIKLIPGTATGTLTISDGTNNANVTVSLGIVIAPNDSRIRHIGPINVGAQEAITITTGVGARFAYTGDTARVRFNVFGVTVCPDILWRVDNGAWNRASISATTPFITVAPTYTNSTSVKSNTHIVEMMYAVYCGASNGSQPTLTDIWTNLTAAVRFAGIDMVGSAYGYIALATYGIAGSGITKGAGGLATAGVGAFTYNGGDGVDGNVVGANISGGGGGAAGYSGPGGAAFQWVGGTGDNTLGGTGGTFDGTAGNPGTEYDATHGSGGGGGGSSNAAVGGAGGLYGSGGGGGGSAGGAGRQGLIIITSGGTVTFIASGTSYTVPSTWNNGSNSIETIGNGGNGGFAFTTTGGGGGGGGAYSRTVNVNLRVGDILTVQVGAGGGTNTTFVAYGGLVDSVRSNPNTIMVMGDSITQTALELSVQGAVYTNDQTTEAPQFGYPKYLADYLGMDLVQIGYAGQGVTIAGSGGVPVAITALGFGYSGFSWSPPTNPQIVLLYQGTNDSAASSAAFQTAYRALAVAIRVLYPRCLIVGVNPYGCTRYTDIRTALSTLTSTLTLDASGIGWLPNDFSQIPHIGPGGNARLAAWLMGQISAQIYTWWALTPPSTTPAATTVATPTYANIVPTAPSDGITHATAAVLTSTEATLAAATAVDPIPVSYNMEVVANISITITGGPNAGDAYVVMQHDLGDGVWYDLAWQNIAGSAGNVANSYNMISVIAASTVIRGPQVKRTAGNNPGTAGTSGGQILGGLVGGRIRFVGKSTLSGGTPVCTVAITYKLRAPR